MFQQQPGVIKHPSLGGHVLVASTLLIVASFVVVYTAGVLPGPLSAHIGTLTFLSQADKLWSPLGAGYMVALGAFSLTFALMALSAALSLVVVMIEALLILGDRSETQRVEVWRGRCRRTVVLTVVLLGCACFASVSQHLMWSHLTTDTIFDIVMLSILTTFGLIFTLAYSYYRLRGETPPWDYISPPTL